MPRRNNSWFGSTMTSPSPRSLLLLLLLVLVGPPRAHAQIWVSSGGSGSVAQYDLQTGALLNANFISGLDGTQMGDVVYDSGSLYVASGSYIHQFNANTGASINPTYVGSAPLVGGSLRPFSLFFTPTHLFVLSINPRQQGSTGEVVLYDGPSPAGSSFVVAGVPAANSPTIFSFVVTGTKLRTSTTTAQVSMYSNTDR